MSSYVQKMRQMIGHETLLFCGASVIIINEKNQVLLQKRKDNLCWAYHGGSVELDEYVEDAARRELYEETGLVAKELVLFGVFSGPQMHYLYPNGDDAYIIDTVFLCQ